MHSKVIPFQFPCHRWCVSRMYDKKVICNSITLRKELLEATVEGAAAVNIKDLKIRNRV